jgi:hypothetical protein
MRSTTTVLLGAVCEMLSEMLERQAHDHEGTSNPYVTHDDFDKLRELETAHEMADTAIFDDQFSVDDETPSN